MTNLVIMRTDDLICTFYLLICAADFSVCAVNVLDWAVVTGLELL